MEGPKATTGLNRQTFDEREYFDKGKKSVSRDRNFEEKTDEGKQDDDKDLNWTKVRKTMKEAAKAMA